MDDSDKKKFAQQMMIAAEIYEKEISKEKLQIYFATLINYPIDAVVHGIQSHMRDTKHGTFFPKPADIVRHIEAAGVSQEDRSELAWMEIENAIRMIGSYGTLKLEDKVALAAVKSLGSWKDLCMTDIDKMQWKRKEFIEAYKTFSNTPLEMLPKSLPGIEELHNQRLESKGQLSEISKGLEEFKARSGN